MATVSDDLQRPDAPTLGPKWAEYTLGYHLASGAAMPDGDGGTNVAQLVDPVATGDHYVEHVQGNSYGGSFTGINARMPALGTSHANTGAFYSLLLSGSTGKSLSIRRKEANSSIVATLETGTAATDARLDGAVWRLWVYQDPDNPTVVQLRGYLNGALVVSASDATGTVPATQRRVGIYSGGTNASLQRFGSLTGADLAAPAAAADSVAPSTPTGLTATATSPNTVALSWAAATDNLGVVSYRVRRNGADLPGALAVTGTQFSDINLTAGTTYSYTVSAVDAAGNRSNESAAASVTTPGVADTTPPPVPSGLTATAGVGSVALSWSPVSASDLAGYFLYRTTSGGTFGSPLATLTGTSYTDTSGTPGTAYSYAVASRDSTGNVSARSSTATATPTAPAPPAGGGGGGVTGFYLWNGTAEVPLTLEGIWNGTAVVPITSVELIP